MRNRYDSLLAYIHLFILTEEYCLHWDDITKSMLSRPLNYVNIYKELQGTKFSNYSSLCIN